MIQPYPKSILIPGCNKIGKMPGGEGEYCRKALYVCPQLIVAALHYHLNLPNNSHQINIGTQVITVIIGNPSKTTDWVLPCSEEAELMNLQQSLSHSKHVFVEYVSR